MHDEWTSCVVSDVCDLKIWAALRRTELLVPLSLKQVSDPFDADNNGLVGPSAPMIQWSTEQLLVIDE
eukprot:6200158-Pleurochrysis_carterae.AAC.1